MTASVHRLMAMSAGSAPLFFVASAIVATLVTPGYSSVRDTFSLLAGPGMPHPWVIAAGFAGGNRQVDARIARRRPLATSCPLARRLLARNHCVPKRQSLFERPTIGRINAFQPVNHMNAPRLVCWISSFSNVSSMDWNTSSSRCWMNGRAS